MSNIKSLHANSHVSYYKDWASVIRNTIRSQDTSDYWKNDKFLLTFATANSGQ